MPYVCRHSVDVDHRQHRLRQNLRFSRHLGSDAMSAFFFLVLVGKNCTINLCGSEGSDLKKKKVFVNFLSVL